MTELRPGLHGHLWVMCRMHFLTHTVQDFQSISFFKYLKLLYCIMCCTNLLPCLVGTLLCFMTKNNNQMSDHFTNLWYKDFHFNHILICFPTNRQMCGPHLLKLYSNTQRQPVSKLDIWKSHQVFSLWVLGVSQCCPVKLIINYVKQQQWIMFKVYCDLLHLSLTVLCPFAGEACCLCLGE